MIKTHKKWDSKLLYYIVNWPHTTSRQHNLMDKMFKVNASYSNKDNIDE